MHGLSLSLVLISALIDSINPCAFGVMIFLISYLLSVASKKKLLKVGLIYIFTVFFSYLLAGLGLLKILTQFTIISLWVYKIAAVILIISGLIDIKEMFWYKIGPSLAIPKFIKPSLKKLVNKATIPATIVLGFLVASFELPCTGQVYLGILSLLSKNSSFLLGFIWLIIYNLIFVLPLFIILLLFYFDKSTEWFKNLNDRKKKFMRLASGLLMLVLGILMLMSKI